MSTLLEQALQKVGALPPDEQDAIARQILETLADEEAWKKLFAAKRDVIRRMADEALPQETRATPYRWMTCVDPVSCDPAVPKTTGEPAC